jgi:hypothetical protein
MARSGQSRAHSRQSLSLLLCPSWRGSDEALRNLPNDFTRLVGRLAIAEAEPSSKHET